MSETLILSFARAFPLVLRTIVNPKLRGPSVPRKAAHMYFPPDQPRTCQPVRCPSSPTRRREVENCGRAVRLEAARGSLGSKGCNVRTDEWEWPQHDKWRRWRSGEGECEAWIGERRREVRGEVWTSRGSYRHHVLGYIAR